MSLYRNELFGGHISHAETPCYEPNPFYDEGDEYYEPSDAEKAAAAKLKARYDAAAADTLATAAARQKSMHELLDAGWARNAREAREREAKQAEGGA